MPLCNSSHNLLLQIRHGEFPQRQDSTYKQLIDLIPAFDKTNMKLVSEEVSSVIIQTDKESNVYAQFIEDFDCDFGDMKFYKQINLARGMANMFGCYDAAEFIGGLNVKKAA